MTSSPPPTYDLSLLERSVTKWESSPALRAVYADIFKEMRDSMVDGSVLEIGSGIGIARHYFPGLVASDIVRTSFVERVVSAYEIPTESWSNIIAMDVLHHLQEPLRFFESAAAGLVSGGRVILVEPAGTIGGRLFYRLIHHEPCQPDKVQPPFRFPAEVDGSFANMGMAHALFGRHRALINAHLQGWGLRLVSITYRDLLAYPATGGFSKSALLPAPILRAILGAEGLLPQSVLRLFALRMIVVLEKQSPT